MIDNTANATTQSSGVPQWYLETFEKVQHIDGGLRHVEREIWEAIEMEPLDERVRTEMRGVLNALHRIKGTLVLVDMAARQVLDEMVVNAA